MGDIDIETVRSWLEVAAILAGIVGAFWRYDHRQNERNAALNRRLDQQDSLAKAVKDDLDKQFGGNGGGIREAINRIDDRLENVEQRLDRHVEAHNK